MAKTSKRQIFVIVIVVFSVFLSSFSLFIYQILSTPNVLVDQEDRTLLIPQGSDFKFVQNQLYNERYVENLVYFSFMAKLMKYHENVKPGRYLLKKDMTNYAAISLLRSGEQEPTNITFSNVRLKSELANKICTNIQLKEVEFDSLLNDTDIQNKYGFNEHTIMSMFVPNTYEVYWNVSGPALMERMHQEYEKFWNDERLKKAEALSMSPIEVSILASIVQSEQLINEDERPMIAGLYMNRLKMEMKLESDPTLVFAGGDFTVRRVLDKDKEIESPYNTYKYKGLPPGPIYLPSISSIDAVLNHEDHSYIFMCAKEDFSGYHNFAVDLSGHLKNARIYQQALNRARLYR